MSVIFMDFPQNLCDHMPEKSDPFGHNAKQNLLVSVVDLRRTRDLNQGI